MRVCEANCHVQFCTCYIIFDHVAAIYFICIISHAAIKYVAILNWLSILYTYIPYAYKSSQEVCLANGDEDFHRYNSQKLETGKTSHGGCHERLSPCWPCSVHQFCKFLLSQFKPTTFTVMSHKKLHTYGTYGVIRSSNYANDVYIHSGSLRCIICSTWSVNSI